MLELDAATEAALLYVESGGQGFGPDGRLLIRFENHVFYREWGKASEPNAKAFAALYRYDQRKPWTEHEFREKPRGEWQPVHGNKQLGEWSAFTVARRLSEPAAMRSVSMGLPQTMGFNHALVGYDSARGMFDAYSGSLQAQVLGLFDFLKGRGPASEALQALQRRQYHRVAELYNGQGQADQYAVWLERAAAAFPQPVT